VRLVDTSTLPPNLVTPLLKLADNMGQQTDAATGNLGFGHLYHGLTRLLRPEVVVCIGSYRGFAPICFTRGLVENQRGRCYFIDPGKVDDYWRQAATVDQLSDQFGLWGYWCHLCLTSQEAVQRDALPAEIDLLFIDGDHSYTGVKYDFETVGRRVKVGGIILLHDSHIDGTGFTPWEVRKYLEAEVYGKSGYEVLNLPATPGLAIFRKLR